MRFHAKIVLFSFLGVLLMGTLGFRFIEGFTWIDAFYMTVITITTVGFGEVHPLSETGRLFTVFLIFSGFGVAVVALSEVTTAIMRGDLQRFLGRIRMKTELGNLTGHYILAGYGRTGQAIVDHLLKKNMPMVVIETHPDSVKALGELGVPYILGNASDEQVLRDAGIERAKGFVSVVSSDADNAFAIMTAKVLNPSLRIVTRALDGQSVRKLKLAGAHKVISPFLLGGTRIAQAILNPAVVDFVEIMEDSAVKELEMADIEIRSKSALDGVNLDSSVVKALEIIIIGILKSTGEFCYRPKGSTQLVEGDRLVVVGNSSQIEATATTATATF